MEQVTQTLSHTLPGQVFLPQDAEYAESLTSYFSAQESQVKPACVVHPDTTQGVSAIVTSLVQANQSHGIGSIKFAIRSGGHSSFAGSANEHGGVTIDLRGLNSIEVSEDQNQVTIGTGASWGEVYRALDPLSLAVPGGRHSQVGVGGLTLGGGLSHFSGHVGLVCDNVLAYEIVLASGITVQVKRDSPQYNDLFRALQGGSNNFGIVTRFTFRVFRQGRLWGGTLVHGIDTRNGQLKAFHDFADSPNYDPFASLTHSFGMSAQGSAFVNGIVYTKLPVNEPDAFKPFIELEPIYSNTLRELSLIDLTREQDAFNENGLCQIMIATTYYLHLPLLHRTYDLWHTSCSSVKHLPGIRWSMTFQPIVPAVIAKSPFLQEAIPRPPAARSIVVAQLTGTWEDQNDTPALEAAGKKLICEIDEAAQEEKMRTGYIYLNYAHSGQNVFGDGERKKWLQGVSMKYDPDGIFQRCVPGGFKLF